MRHPVWQLLGVCLPFLRSQSHVSRVLYDTHEKGSRMLCGFTRLLLLKNSELERGSASVEGLASQRKWQVEELGDPEVIYFAHYFGLARLINFEEPWVTASLRSLELVIPYSSYDIHGETIGSDVLVWHDLGPTHPCTVLRCQNQLSPISPYLRGQSSLART